MLQSTQINQVTLTPSLRIAEENALKNEVQEFFLVDECKEACSAEAVDYVLCLMDNCLDATLSIPQLAECAKECGQLDNESVSCIVENCTIFSEYI